MNADDWKHAIPKIRESFFANLDEQNVSFSIYSNRMVLSLLDHLHLEQERVLLRGLLTEFENNPKKAKKEEIRKNLGLPEKHKEDTTSTAQKEVNLHDLLEQKKNDTGERYIVRDSNVCQASLYGMLEYFCTDKKFEQKKSSEKDSELRSFICGYKCYNTNNELMACLEHIHQTDQRCRKETVHEIVKLWYELLPEDFSSSAICKTAAKLTGLKFRVFNVRRRRYIDPAAKEMAKKACYEFLLIHKFGKLTRLSKIPRFFFLLYSIAIY